MIQLSSQGFTEKATVLKNLDENWLLTKRQLGFQSLSKKDDIRQRIILINALIDFGRVEKVPSRRLDRSDHPPEGSTSRALKTSVHDISEQGNGRRRREHGTICYIEL